MILKSPSPEDKQQNYHAFLKKYDISVSSLVESYTQKTEVSTLPKSLDKEKLPVIRVSRAPTPIRMAQRRIAKVRAKFTVPDRPKEKFPQDEPESVPYPIDVMKPRIDEILKAQAETSRLFGHNKSQVNLVHSSRYSKQRKISKDFLGQRILVKTDSFRDQLSTHGVVPHVKSTCMLKNAASLVSNSK